MKPLRAAIAVAFLLAGCGTQGPIADELTAFNKAQQQGTAQLVLLNILRAREGQPFSYSHFDVLRGGVNASSSAGLSIPFGPNASILDPRILSASAGLAPGISQDVKPQDDQNFYRGILTPVTEETWALYQDQNWPIDLLFHLFVEDIKLSQADFETLMQSTARVCASHSDIADIGGNCQALSETKSAIAKRGCPMLKHLANGKELLDAYNDPRDRCHLLQFEAFTYGLNILGFHIATEKSENDVGPALDAAAFHDLKWPFSLKDSGVKIAASPDGRSYQFKQTSSGYAAELSNLPRLDDEACPTLASVAVAATSEIGSQIHTLTKKNETTQSRNAVPQCRHRDPIQIQITTRSPDGMLYYLGEVARAELPLHESDPSEVVTVYNEGGQPLPLLKIEAGDLSEYAVKVNYNGVTYSVPRGDDHVTMQAVELIEQIYALYNQASTAPSTTAVTVVP